MQKLKVKGVAYKIYIGETPHLIDGLCYKYDKKIIISNQLEKDRVIYVLCHELAHAYIHECYLDQTLERSQEETMCEIAATLVEEFGSFITELKKKLK